MPTSSRGENSCASLLTYSLRDTCSTRPRRSCLRKALPTTASAIPYFLASSSDRRIADRDASFRSVFAQSKIVRLPTTIPRTRSAAQPAEFQSHPAPVLCRPRRVKPASTPPGTISVHSFDSLVDLFPADFAPLQGVLKMSLQHRIQLCAAQQKKTDIESISCFYDPSRHERLRFLKQQVVPRRCRDESG